MPQKTGRRKLQTPRIDLTPMVDLGFLLITFFMITTTMAKPRVMDINMPYKTSENKTVFVEEATITLIPIGGHRIAYYNGILKIKDQLMYKPMGSIRELLLNKKKVVAALPATFSADAHKLHVLIRPSDKCRYEDLVAVMDEMLIVDVPYYAIMDVTAEENEWIEK